MLTDARLREVADQLLEVPGVAAVMLGGSRARGAEKPDSDVDLGLYYRPPLDVDKLQALADDPKKSDHTLISAISGSSVRCIVPLLHDDGR